MGTAASLFNHDELVLCFGAVCTSLILPCAEFYAFATKAFDRNCENPYVAREYVRWGRRVCQALADKHGHLTMHALKDDEKNHRFLCLMGWRPGEAVIVPSGAACRRYTMEGVGCVA